MYEVSLYFICDSVNVTSKALTLYSAESGKLQVGKLQTGKVQANYQCSPLPREMRSAPDDNMAIHFSLDQSGSGRSMGRMYQKPKCWTLVRAGQSSKRQPHQ